MTIINIKPEIRQKGFSSNNFEFSQAKFNISENLFKKINYIKNNLNSLNLKDKTIINKIISSYNNLEKNQKIEPDGMILEKHELLEFEKISDKNLIRYLIYRYKYKIFPKLKIVDAYPPCVQIEPTSICNFRCIMCYQADKSFSNKSNGFMGHMPINIFKRIIDEIDGKIEAVTLASRGEPTLNQNIEEMINYSKGKFLALKINTNASMLNEKLIHTLLSSDIQTIVFSIDSKDKENYEKIRINGKFEKTLKNLEMFNKIRNKHYDRDHKIVRISGVKINTEQNIDEMKKKWGDIADIVAFTNYTPWESSYENEENNIKDPCQELWTRMFIWWDGKVNPCDYDYKSKLSKWNLKEKKITEIWNSKEYNELRNFHLNKKRNLVDPCKRCIST